MKAKKFKPDQVIKGSVQDITVLLAPDREELGLARAEATNRFSIYDFGGDSVAPETRDRMKWRALALNAMRHYFLMQIGNPLTWSRMVGSGFLARYLGDKTRTQAVEMICDLGLLQHGMPTHHKGMEYDGDGILQKLDIPPDHLTTTSVFALARVPGLEEHRQDDGSIRYVYRRRYQRNFMVPVECIFRLGLPKGSSVFRRIAQVLPEEKAALLATLGWKEKRDPEPYDMLPEPLVEFTTKYEPDDRHLTLAEAAKCSLLTPDKFEELRSRTYLAALMLLFLVEEASERLPQGFELQLWDGKFEWLVDEQGELVLADTIDTDGVRLTLHHAGEVMHFSKELVRQTIDGTPWLPLIKKIQELARQSGKDWKKAWRQNGLPQHLPYPEEVVLLFDRMHAAAAFAFTGNEVFSAPGADLEALFACYLEARSLKAKFRNK